MTTGTNWAGNYTYGAATLLLPETVEAVQEIAASAPCLRVLGSRHSFNGIADTQGDLVSLEALDPGIAIDSAARTVSLSGGVRYGELARALDAHGWALHNLASLPHISVAGAIATGTHGSGVRSGTLASAVVGLELVTSSGELVSITKDSSDFEGAVVSLGALGVVTRLELAIEPAYQVEQRVFEGLGWSEATDHFEEIMSSAYSVSMFTDWSSLGIQQVWVKSRVETARGGRPQSGVTGSTAPNSSGPELFGAVPATTKRHMIAGIDPVNCTEQFGVAGHWYDRLPHFRLDFTPSNGEEIQSEYLLPRSRVAEAMHAVRAISGVITPLIQASEIRTMSADDLWLSGAFGQETVAFHFTLGARPAAGRDGAAGPGGRPGAVRCPAALGQGVRRGCRPDRRALPPDGGFSRSGRTIGRAPRLPECVHRPIHFRRRLIARRERRAPRPSRCDRQARVVRPESSGPSRQPLPLPGGALTGPP